jgi:hypothetical protein
MGIAGDYDRVKTSLGASIVRTVVPIVVGAVTAALAKINLGLDAEAATAVVTVVLSTAYYTGIRLLEELASPAWGRLLGIARVPQYVDDGHWVDVDEIDDEEV